MTIKVGSNIASVQAQRRLGEATASLGKIYERLSSGQRINAASDDAAGLAIANDLNAKYRVYTQAIRNGNDGISALNIADSAIDNLTSVITRIRELTEQSANGTYSNKQRAALDNEAQALSKEFLRIAQTTSFNGVKIFNGSLGDGLRLQLGYGVEGSINANIGGAIGTGSLAASASYSATTASARGITLGDLNGDGILDLVTSGYGGGGFTSVRLGTGSGTFGVATSYQNGVFSFGVALGDLNNDGNLDLVTANYSGGGSASVRLGTGFGTFGASISYTADANFAYSITLGDLNGDGILDLVTAGYDGGSASATVRLGSGSGTFGAATSYIIEGTRTNKAILGDLNGDGILDLVTAGEDYTVSGVATIRLGTGNGTFGASTSYAGGTNIYAVSLGDLNGDGILDLVTAGEDYGVGNFATVRLGTGSGTFGAAASFVVTEGTTLSSNLGDLNGDGILDLITSGSAGGAAYTAVRLGAGNGSFGTSVTYADGGFSSSAVALGDLNGDGVLDIATATRGSSGFATTRLGNVRDGLGGLLQFSLKTKTDALQAMGQLQRAQDNLAKQRGVIGAAQSRIGIALQGLATSKENFSAAESRIKDADIAAEAGNLIRTQILQQAATSVLAQANNAPQLALTLLR